MKFSTYVVLIASVAANYEQKLESISDQLEEIVDALAINANSNGY
jgi:hypothetical protein